MNVIEILLERAAERPATVAIVAVGRGGHEEVVTLRELERMSARVAFQLHAAGIGEGDRVMVFEKLGVNLYAVLLGVFRLGAVAVLLDPSARHSMLERCGRRAALKAIVGGPQGLALKAMVPSLRRVRYFATGGLFPGVKRLDANTALPLREDVATVKAETPALMTFTSGSTGEPKAAVRTHGFLRSQHAVVAASLDLRPGDVELTTLPVFVIANIASGITSVLPDADMRFPARIKVGPVERQVRRWLPNRALGSPAFFRALVRGWRGEGGPSFKRIYTGGGPVFPGMLREIRAGMEGAEVVIVYGSTEAEPISHISVEAIREDQWEDMGRGRGLLVGRPIPETNVRVVKSKPGKALGRMRHKHFEQLVARAGEPGEIVVSGAHVLGGYLDGIGDEETKFHVDGTVWHRTGDAGCIDEEGALWLLGRRDAVVRDKYGEMFPFAVECCALQFEWVESAACIAWEEERTLLVVANRPVRAEEERELCKAVEWAKLMHVLETRHIPLDRRHNAKVEYPLLRKKLRDDRYVRRLRSLRA